MALLPVKIATHKDVTYEVPSTVLALLLNSPMTEEDIYEAVQHGTVKYEEDCFDERFVGIWIDGDYIKAKEKASNGEHQG